MIDVGELFVGIILGIIINSVMMIIFVPMVLKHYLRKMTQDMNPMDMVSKMFGGVDDDEFDEGMNHGS